MNALVEIKSVRYSVKVGFWMRRRDILLDVDLVVPKGSVTGFLGPNGAGKTSLIQLLVGIRKPVSGHIRIGGHPAGSREARSLLGFLPERPYFPTFLTARQVLTQYGKLSGMDASTLQSAIPTVLDQVGIARAIDQELRTYSKGMLQRLGIAQAILHRPELLVLDEPMSGLDPVGRYEIRALIQRLAREGHTIFFSSHVVPDVEAIADRLALIQRGRIVRADSTAAVLADDRGGFEAWVEGAVSEALLLPKLQGGLESVEAGVDRTRIVYRGKDALPLIDAIRATGVPLHSINPVRTSIEELFMRGSGK